MRCCSLIEEKKLDVLGCDIRSGIINYIVCPSKLFPPARAIIIFLHRLIGPEAPNSRRGAGARANINNIPSRARGVI